MKLVFGFINRFPKWYVMIPLHQNSQTSLGPLEWAFSRPGTWWRGPWSQLTEQTIQIIFISCSKSKVVPILLLANVFLGIYYNQSIWYKLSGKTKFGAYITIGGALITVAVNLIFSPEYGFMASAWATLLVYFLQMVFSYLLGQRHFPIPYNLKKFFVYVGLALVLFFIGNNSNLVIADLMFSSFCCFAIIV